jgi:hypothetical protein
MSTTPRFVGPQDPFDRDTFIFDTQMEAFLRVKIDSNGEAAAAGAADKAIGVTWQGEAADASNTIRFLQAGTSVMTAAGAISVGDRVYAAASGKVAATGTVFEGIALSAATADGDRITVLPDAAMGVVAPENYAVTATADGLTTGIIPDGGRIVFAPIASADANHIVVLPAPTPGTIVIGFVGANGCELRSSAPATVGINGGTGASAESAIAANQMFVAICTSATSWHGWEITAATLTAIEAAA